MNKLKFFLIYLSLFILNASIFGQVDPLPGDIDSLILDDKQIVSEIYNTANLLSPEVYPSIKNKFKIETINNKTFGAFLGGLTPKRKMTSALKLSDEDNGLYPLDCRNSEKIMLVVEVNDDYKFIQTQEDLYETFQPIDSPQEALSFVHLREGGLPLTIFDEEDPFFEEVQGLKTISRTDNGYLIKLVVYDPCGMHGEASLNTYSINSAGEIKIIDSQYLRNAGY